MTIKIEISAHPELGDMQGQVERAMSALGFVRTSTVSPLSLEKAKPSVAQIADAEARAKGENLDGTDRRETVEAETEPEQTETEAPAVTLDKRLIGAPAEGNKRRNSAEKAEDDGFEALAAEKGVSLDQLNAAITQAGRDEARRQLEGLEKADKHVDEPVTIASMKTLPDDASADDVAREFAAISTGEERIGPEDEQDAADEAAETDKAGLAPIDVLRRLVGAYQKQHGMPAAVKLCQEGGLIGKALHDLSDDEIGAAIEAMQSDAPAPKVEKKAEPEVAPKTKEDLIEAMLRYADKFDGTREQAKMKATLEDCPLIFVDVFGPEVTKLSLVPEDGYGKAVAAIDKAIETDPYGRAK